jgi:hypothetical protein
MVKIQIRMNTELFRVLNRLARAEMRDPRDQATILIRQTLEQRGLLNPDPECAQDAQAVPEQGGKNA